jgi:pyruvate, orthophosphate dikinase
MLTVVNSELLLKSSLTGEHLRSGDLVTVDGGGGRLLRGLHSTVSHLEDEDFQTVLGWADKYRKLRINASISSTCWNKPTSTAAGVTGAGGGMAMLEQVREAQRMGADGLGCICTDGMFNSTEERSNLTCNLLMHHLTVNKNIYLNHLGDMHKEDFKAIFRCAKDRTVMVKLLDCPLQKFLPQTDAELFAFSDKGNFSVAQLRRSIAQLSDNNPDFGFRGCRILGQFPEIIKMQVGNFSAQCV